jgi:hypothetical protein
MKSCTNSRDSGHSSIAWRSRALCFQKRTERPDQGHDKPDFHKNFTRNEVPEFTDTEPWTRLPEESGFVDPATTRFHIAVDQAPAIPF